MNKRQCYIKDNIVHIPLTKGYEAICDIEDYDLVKTRTWCASVGENLIYAISYTKISEGGIKRLYLHRLIIPGYLHRDHINGDGLNNRRCNLRICSPSENHGNERKRKLCSSIYKGVCKRRRNNQWESYIMKDRIKYHLGYFIEEVEAAKVYNKKAIELFGEFAYLNMVE